MSKPESNLASRRNMLIHNITEASTREFAEGFQAHGAILTLQFLNLYDLFTTYNPQTTVSTLKDYLGPITVRTRKYEGTHEGYRGEDQLTLTFGTLKEVTYDGPERSDYEKRAVETALSVKSILA